MAINEVNTRIKYKDASGNTTVIYPITRKENVENLGEQICFRSITTEGDGAAYTATVDGVDTLEAGISFIINPHVASTSTTPTLNVNNLGAKTLRRRISSNTGVTVEGSSEDWLGSNKPIRVTYDGEYWIADLYKPSASDFYGTVPIVSGGTGADTAESARANLGAMTDVPVTSADAGNFLRVSRDGKWVSENVVGEDLEDAGYFGGSTDVNTFVVNTLNSMMISNNDIRFVRRWACVYDMWSAILTIVIGINDERILEAMATIETPDITWRNYYYTEGIGESGCYEFYFSRNGYEWVPISKNPYVTSDYTSGIWRIRKWSNGEVELWTTIEKTGISLNSWNNVYGSYNAVPAETYPVTFASSPAVMATAMSTGANSYSIMSGEIPGTVTTSPSFGVFRGGPASKLNICVALYVKGTIAS